MRQPSNDKTSQYPDDGPSVPSKSDILLALQSDQGRAGLQLEWMLDRCDKREGESTW